MCNLSLPKSVDSNDIPSIFNGFPLEDINSEDDIEASEELLGLSEDEFSEPPTPEIWNSETMDIDSNFNSEDFLTCKDLISFGTSALQAKYNCMMYPNAFEWKTFPDELPMRIRLWANVFEKEDEHGEICITCGEEDKENLDLYEKIMETTGSVFKDYILQDIHNLNHQFFCVLCNRFMYRVDLLDDNFLNTHF